MKKLSQAPMDLERLSALLDAYGAELARMPEAEREQVRALIASDARAAQLHARAAQLDALLDAAPPVPDLSPALRARVAELPLRHPRAERAAAFWPWPGLWRFVAAGALAAMLGAVGGTFTADENTTNDDDGWDEIASVAFVTGIEEEP